MTPPSLSPAAPRAHARLQAWGPLVAGAVLLAILWGLVLIFAVVQERRMVEGARQQLRLINNAASVQTRDLLQSAEHNLDLLQMSIARAAPGTPADNASHQMLLAMNRHAAGLITYALVGESGAAVPSAGVPPWVPSLPRVTMPAAAGELRLGEPVRQSAGGAWFWPITRRLASPAGDVAGMVAWVDLGRLGAVHERLREKPAGAISIATPAGLLVLRTPHIDGLVGRSLGRDRLASIPQNVAQGDFEHDGALTGGQPRLASFERLGRYPVTVVVSQEFDEILAAFHRRRNLGIGALVAITACAVAFGVVFTRSRRAMRRSDAQFDAVSNAFPLGLFMTDTHGETTYANDAYFGCLGLPPDRLAWGWSDLLDPSQRTTLVAQWREAAAGGQPIRSLLTVRQPGGREVALSVRTAPLRVDGRLVGQIGSMEDVTERIAQQRAQRMLTAIFDKSTDIVAQVSADGRMLYLNPAGRALLALGPDDPIDQLRYDDFLPAHRETQVRDVILPTAEFTGIWVGETSVLCGDGREIDVSEMLIVHRDEQQAVETYSVVMRDITQERHARLELQRSQSILDVVAATLPVLVAVADRNQRYLFTNDAFARWVGRPQGRLVGQHARDVLGDVEYARRRPYIEAAMAGQRVMFESAPDGNQFFETTYIPFRDADGEVAGLVALSQDITAHKRQHQKLLDASQTDVLTGTLNRAGFDQRVTEALARARAAHQPLALLFVDLDRFKPINDEHGHATGDALLEAVAQRLLKVLRPSDMLARLGGDEFAVVLPEVKDEAAAGTVARKIVSSLGEPFEVDGKRLHIGASVGLALTGTAHETLQSLTRRADVALYQAKRSGRGRYEVAETKA